MKEKKNLTRRNFLKTASIVTSGTLLAACAPSTTTSPTTSTEASEATKAPDTALATEVQAEPTKPPEPTEAPAVASGVTLRWWTGWNIQKSVDAILLTDEGKAALGNNQLEWKAAQWQEFSTAIAAGDPPDAGSNFDYPQLIYKGALLPIDDLVTTSQFIKKDDIMPPIWDYTFYTGKMMGIPACDAFVWLGNDYNGQLVKDAGLDPDKPPVTWDETLNWHKTLTTKDSAGNLMQIGLDPYDAMGGELDTWGISYGFQWWDDKSNTFDVNNDEFIQGLDMANEFYKIMGPDAVSGMRQVEGMGNWGAALNSGVQAMMLTGSWTPAGVKASNLEWGAENRAVWAPVSSDRKDKKIAGAFPHLFALFKDAKNQEATFTFGEVLHTKTALDIMYNMSGFLLGKISWLKTIDPSVAPGLQFYFDAVEEATDWTPLRRCPISGYAVSQFAELREKTYRGQMNSADAAAELQKRLELELKNSGLV